MRGKLIYRSPKLYSTAMRVLYGSEFRERSRIVADLIDPRSSVVDLCCGPGYLYRDFLREKQVSYTGIDASEEFVAAVRAHGAIGIRADLHDIEAPLPAADFVVMQASLYHFLPSPEFLIERMLNAARLQVIISEPIRNLSTSNSPIIRTIAFAISGGPSKGSQRRFNEETLDALFERYRDHIQRALYTPSKREKIFVLSKNK